MQEQKRIDVGSPSFQDIWGNFLIGKVRIMEARTDRSSIILLLSQIIRNQTIYCPINRSHPLGNRVPWIWWTKKCKSRVKTVVFDQVQEITTKLWIDFICYSGSYFLFAGYKVCASAIKESQQLESHSPFQGTPEWEKDRGGRVRVLKRASSSILLLVVLTLRPLIPHPSF